MTFALSLKQMGSSSFHMFIYARSEQCDLGTITNTQHIRIYPGNLSWSKFHRIQEVYMENMPKKTKENQTLFTFLTTENLSRFSCSHESKKERIQLCNCPVIL